MGHGESAQSGRLFYHYFCTSQGEDQITMTIVYVAEVQSEDEHGI
jgi:hypothetical protein